MRDIWEVRGELQQVLLTERAAEDRVMAALQPVFSVPDLETGQSFEITAEYLQHQITLLATRLMRDMQAKRVLLLGLMDGAGFFADALLRAIALENQARDPQNQFITEYATLRTSSYAQTESGELKIDSLKEEVGERVVVVLDDILDTGKTLAGVMDYLYSKGASEVYSMVLFDKQIPQREFSATYCGIRISGDYFYVGAGMDYLTPRFRQLPHLKAVDRNTLLTEAEEAIVSRKHALNLELESIIAANQKASLGAYGLQTQPRRRGALLPTNQATADDPYMQLTI